MNTYTSISNISRREILAKMLFELEDYYNGLTSGGIDPPRQIQRIEAINNNKESRIKIIYTLPAICNVGVSPYHVIEPNKERIKDFIISDDYESDIDNFYNKLNPNKECESEFVGKIKEIKRKMKITVSGNEYSE